MKAPKIIATRLSKVTPLTAERRRAIDAQAADAEAAVAFLDVTDAIATRFPDMTPEERRRIARVLINGTASQVREWGDVITVYLPDRLCRAPYDGGAEFVRAYHEARKRQPRLARAMTEAATARQARAKRATAHQRG